MLQELLQLQVQRTLVLIISMCMLTPQSITCLEHMVEHLDHDKLNLMTGSVETVQLNYAPCAEVLQDAALQTTSSSSSTLSQQQ